MKKCNKNHKIFMKSDKKPEFSSSVDGSGYRDLFLGFNFQRYFQWYFRMLVSKGLKFYFSISEKSFFLGFFSIFSAFLLAAHGYDDTFDKGFPNNPEYLEAGSPGINQDLTTKSTLFNDIFMQSFRDYCYCGDALEAPWAILFCDSSSFVELTKGENWIGSAWDYVRHASQLRLSIFTTCCSRFSRERKTVTNKS